MNKVNKYASIPLAAVFSLFVKELEIETFKIDNGSVILEFQRSSPKRNPSPASGDFGKLHFSFSNSFHQIPFYFPSKKADFTPSLKYSTFNFTNSKGENDNQSLPRALVIRNEWTWPEGHLSDCFQVKKD